MKPNPFKSICAALLLIVAGSLSAQNNPQQMGDVAHHAVNNNAISKSSKNFIAAEAVETRFAALYPTASNMKWSGGPDDYVVAFDEDGKKVEASFTSSGKLNYAIKHCSPNQLPASFTQSIKSAYKNYKVFQAMEIQAHGAVAYQAIIENTKGYITLKYAENEVEETAWVRKTPVQ